MVNAGLFSFGNGHRPVSSRPRLSSRTERPTTPDSGTRLRSSSRKESGKAINPLPRTRLRIWADKLPRLARNRLGQKPFQDGRRLGEIHLADIFRSEERRVGKERVSTCRSRWSQFM